MDIKGVVRNLIPLPWAVKSANEARSTHSKTNADNDREGNGQAAGEEQKRRKLSPEEIADAVNYLKELPGVKENSLNIRLEQVEGVTVVYVEDRFGKLVRRIPESELAFLTADREKKSGHLLNKAL